jgi:hypothetical protein
LSITRRFTWTPELLRSASLYFVPVLRHLFYFFACVSSECSSFFSGWINLTQPLQLLSHFWWWLPCLHIQLYGNGTRNSPCAGLHINCWGCLWISFEINLHTKTLLRYLYLYYMVFHQNQLSCLPFVVPFTKTVAPKTWQSAASIVQFLSFNFACLTTYHEVWIMWLIFSSFCFVSQLNYCVRFLKTRVELSGLRWVNPLFFCFSCVKWLLMNSSKHRRSTKLWIWCFWWYCKTIIVIFTHLIFTFFCWSCNFSCKPIAVCCITESRMLFFSMGLHFRTPTCIIQITTMLFETP